MKKIFMLFVAIIGIALFVSCEKDELTSLDGTHWVNTDFFSDGSLTSELVFATNSVTYIITNNRNGFYSAKIGTYTYTSPSISISVDGISSGEQGTVDGDILTIRVVSGDIIVPLEFKKQ